MTLVPHCHAVLRVCLLFLVGWFLLAHPTASADTVPASTKWGLDPTFGSNGRLLYNPAEPYLPSFSRFDVQVLPNNTIAAQLDYTYRWGKGIGRGTKSVMFNDAGVLTTDITLPEPIIGVQSTGNFITAHWDTVTTQFILRRYTRDLTLDPTFAMTNPLPYPLDPSDCCYDVRIQADDTIFVTMDEHAVIRLAPDGALDPTLVHPVGLFGRIDDIISHPTGSFLVQECTDNTSACAVRLFAQDGTYVNTLVSSSFSYDTLSSFTAAPTPDGGWVWVGHESWRTVIYKSTITGMRDLTFGTNGKVTFPPNDTGRISSNLSLAVQADGGIMFAGMVEDPWQTPAQPFVARLTSTGTFDPNFGSKGVMRMSPVGQIAVQPNGKIVLVGMTHEGFVVQRLAEYTVRGQVFLPLSAW